LTSMERQWLWRGSQIRLYGWHVVMTLCAGNGLIHVIELDLSRSKIWIAAWIADEVDRRRRQVRLFLRDERVRHVDGETKTSCNRAIDLLIAPGADGVIGATAARRASARSVALNAAISLWLAELRPVVRKDLRLAAQVDCQGQHARVCVVCLVRDPVSRGVGGKGKIIATYIHGSRRDGTHRLGLRHLANVKAVGLFGLRCRVNEINFVVSIGEEDIGYAGTGLIGLAQGGVNVIVAVIDGHGAALPIALAHHANRGPVCRIGLVRRVLCVGKKLTV